MKRYISIILTVIMMLLPVYSIAEETVSSEVTVKNVIVSASPADYDEMSGVWNTDGLITKFAKGNGDYPTLGSFINPKGEATYSVDLGNKAGFYKMTEDASNFFAGIWVRLGALNKEKSFIVYSVESDSVNHRALIFYDRTNSKIMLKYYNGDTACAETELTEYANSWVYLNFTRKVKTGGTEFKVYVNGALAASGTSTDTTVSDEDVTLSLATGKTLEYYGSESLGEIEVLSQIPSDAEILNRYTDKAEKYKAAEQNSLIFSLGEEETVVLGSEMTWELWISADTESDGTIFAMGDIENPEAHAVLQDGKVIFRAGRYDDSTYVSSTVCEIESNKLYHLVFTRSYFEDDGIGHFEYSAYCNSVLADGFPYVRRGISPTGEKTSVHVGGASMVITDLDVYDEVLAPDNIRISYLKNASPVSITPADGAKNVSVNTKAVELEYDLPVTNEMLKIQNISIKKNGEPVETVNTKQGNKIICTFDGNLDFSAEYSVYSGDTMFASFKTASKAAYIRYIYDFEDEADYSELKGLSESMKPYVTVETNTATGSKALKIQGNTAQNIGFSIDLPKAVDNRYVLVRMKATVAKVPENMVFSTSCSPSIRDSDGTEALMFKYFVDGLVLYGNGSYNGSTETLYAFPPADNETIKAGRTDCFEAIIDLTEQTADISQSDKNGNVSVAEDKPLIKNIKDVKTLTFEINMDGERTIYYDDIEIIGFDDYSALLPPSYTITGISCEGDTIASLADAAGKTLDIAIDLTGEFAIIGAIYDGSILRNAEICENGVISINVPEDADEKEYTAKLFAWKTLTDITPLFDVQPLFGH